MASLVIDIVAETSKAVAGLNQVGDTATKQQSKFRGMGKAIAGAVSVTAIVAFGKEAVKAASDDAKAQATLAKTLENVTGATGDQVAAAEKYIDSLSKQTAIADDELRPALDTLVRGFGDTAKAQEGLALAADIAAGTGKPLATVVNAMAKAAKGTTGPFAKLTSQTAKAGDKAKTLDELMGGAADTFQNQAAVAAETTAGKMAGAQIAMAEMTETLGSYLLPAIGTLSEFLQDNIKWLGPLALGIAAVTAAIWLWNAATAAMAIIKGIVDGIKAWTLAQGGLNLVLAANPIILIVLAVIALIAIVVLLVKNWDKVSAFLKKSWEALKKAATAVFNAIKDAIAKAFEAVKRVIVAIWNGIKAFFAAYWAALKAIFGPAIAWVKDKITTGFRAISDVIRTVWNAVRDYFTAVWDDITGIFQGAWDFFKKFVDFLGTIGDAISRTWKSVTAVIAGVWDSVVNGLKTAVNWIIDRINSVISAINKAIAVVNKLPGVNIGNIPSIPRLAAGGIVTRPTLAMIGERGPEAVVPLGRAGGVGASFTLNMYPRKADANDVAFGFRRLELLRTGR